MQNEIVQLSGTSNDHLVQLSDYFKDNQHFVQMPLKHLQAWGIQHQQLRGLFQCLTILCK